jgi:hypothetical protein
MGMGMSMGNISDRLHPQESQGPFASFPLLSITHFRAMPDAATKALIQASSQKLQSGFLLLIADCFQKIGEERPGSIPEKRWQRSHALPHPGYGQPTILFKLHEGHLSVAYFAQFIL